MKNKSKTTLKFEKALYSLLEKKNYHFITVNEICTLANKTKMTFYRYYKDKEQLLAEASINLINKEYDDEYNKILKKENDIEEIEYLSTLATYELVAKHYNQISNLVYKGDRFPAEIFKNALFENYRKYMTNAVDAFGRDLPGDYLSIFCFEGLYSSGMYYANQLNKNKNNKKAREDGKTMCRLLAKAVISLAELYANS